MASTIVSTLYFVAMWVLELFPRYTGLPAGVTNALDTVGGNVANVSCIFPVSTFLTIIGLQIPIALGWLGYKFFRNVGKPAA